MAYTVQNTDGSVIAVIEDKIVDTNFALKLLGRDVSGYGSVVAENTLRQLENFASSSAPGGTKLIGQLWYDKSEEVMKVWFGTGWKRSTNIVVDRTPPTTSLTKGTAWFDTRTDKFKIYDGTTFRLTGYAGEVSNAYSSSTSDGNPSNYGTKLRNIFLTASDNLIKPVLAFVHVSDGTVNQGTTNTESGKETVIAIFSDNPSFELKNSVSATEGENINYYSEFSTEQSFGTTIKPGFNLRREYAAITAELSLRSHRSDSAYRLNTGAVGADSANIRATDVIHESKSYIPSSSNTYFLGNNEKIFAGLSVREITLGNSGTSALRANGTIGIGTVASKINTIHSNTITVYDNLVFSTADIASSASRVTRAWIAAADVTSLKINDYNMPTSDGSNGQSIVTDGNGNLRFGTVQRGTDTSTVTAGAGLTGGGTGSTTLNVGAGDFIIVNADSIAVNATSRSISNRIVARDSNGAFDTLAINVNNLSVLASLSIGNGSNNLYRMPTSDGSNGQSIVTDGNGNLRFATIVTSTGDGNVSGPTTSTDNAIPRFDGTSGNIQGSRAIIDDNGCFSTSTPQTNSSKCFTLLQPNLSIGQQLQFTFGIANSTNQNFEINFLRGSTNAANSVGLGLWGAATFYKPNGRFGVGASNSGSQNEIFTVSGTSKFTGATEIDGNLTISGTVDGRNISADGTLLTTISGRTNPATTSNAGIVLRTTNNNLINNFDFLNIGGIAYPTVVSPSQLNTYYQKKLTQSSNAGTGITISSSGVISGTGVGGLTESQVDTKIAAEATLRSNADNLKQNTLTAGTGIRISSNGTISSTVTGGGGGNVSGPTTSINNAITRFNGTSGNIQGSRAIIDDNGCFSTSTTQTVSSKCFTLLQPNLSIGQQLQFTLGIANNANQNFEINFQRGSTHSTNRVGLGLWGAATFYKPGGKFGVGASNSGSQNEIFTVSGTSKFTGATEIDGTLTATASQARYADLAELYLSDVKYPAGTVVDIGGEKEITVAVDDFFGVISTQPGQIMNSSLDDGVPVALAGRVPVRVIGTVNKGSRLVMSELPGVARSLRPGESWSSHQIIGRSLENKVTAEQGRVEAIVMGNR